MSGVAWFAIVSLAMLSRSPASLRVSVKQLTIFAHPVTSFTGADAPFQPRPFVLIAAASSLLRPFLVGFG
ncbi:hypothetical protein C7W93_19745 [Glaciimonas sp. PCH181]|nr:hypothetical protein C7W93_19745 [Glaciimonas sp. PCH181]